MSVKARSRLALACAAAYFGWHLFINLRGALDALAIIIGVNL